MDETHDAGTTAWGVNKGPRKPQGVQDETYGGREAEEGTMTLSGTYKSMDVEDMGMLDLDLIRTRSFIGIAYTSSLSAVHVAG